MIQAQRKWSSARSKRGFTLVEIMIVVLIIGILLNMAIPSFIHARDTGQATACVSNLHNINSAKEEWALEDNEGPSAYPLPSDLQPYLHSAEWPVCPAGGTYTIHQVDTLPTCSYGQAPNAPAHVF